MGGAWEWMLSRPASTQSWFSVRTFARACGAYPIWLGSELEFGLHASLSAMIHVRMVHLDERISNCVSWRIRWKDPLKPSDKEHDARGSVWARLRLILSMPESRHRRNCTGCGRWVKLDAGLPRLDHGWTNEELHSQLWIQPWQREAAEKCHQVPEWWPHFTFQQSLQHWPRIVTVEPSEFIHLENDGEQ